MKLSLFENVNIQSEIIGVLIFLISIIFYNFYIGGDLRIYNQAYGVVEGLSLTKAYSLYREVLYGADYLHFLIIWGCSTLGIHKILLMGLLNAALTSTIFLILRRAQLNLASASLIIFCNYYLWVLFLPAERLKIGVLLLCLSILNKNRPFVFLITSLLAISAHASVIVIYTVMLLVYISRNFHKIRIYFQKINFQKFLLYLILILSILGLWLAIAGPQVYEKILWYRNDALEHAYGFRIIVPVLILGIVAIVWGCNFLEIALVFLPIVAGIFFIGGDRLNMFAVFIFMYYMIDKKPQINFPFGILLIYLSLKSIFFLGKIVIYGNGFL